LLLGLLVLTQPQDVLPAGTHLVAAVGVIASLAATEALARVRGGRALVRDDRGVVDVAAPENQRGALSQTAILTSGLVLAFAFAALAIATG
jgi:hypothetical protein